MLTYVKGDLVRDIKKYDYGIHGANCFHTMGSGIALQVRKTFPQVFAADCQTNYGDKSKLGTYSYWDSGEFTIINAYTQYTPSISERGLSIEDSFKLRYGAILKSFTNIKHDFGSKQKSFAIPLIGAGLAGGDWSIISKLIESAMVDEFVTVVIFEKDTSLLKQFNLK